MSKYTFEKLGSDRFEHLAQALLEKQYRGGGSLKQFGAGKDGAREATWTQPSSHETYHRPINASEDIDKEWVFQAKFHDLGQRGWNSARSDVESDLKKELEKIVNKYKVPCHKYILITNVPFSGVRDVGTRDKINEVINSWKSKIPEIEVWDSTDLSRMLDADPATRTTYLAEVLPGDILQELLKNQTQSSKIQANSYRAYLKSLLRTEADARADEAGDEDELGLKLEKVFIDLDLELNSDPAKLWSRWLTRRFEEESERIKTIETYDEEVTDSRILESPHCVPASFALLRTDYSSLLLKGGPGVGKSTLTQFLCLYHAARLVRPSLASALSERLKLPDDVTSESLDAHCEVRFPLRIELKLYAKWVDKLPKNKDPHFAAYFVERINRAASSSLVMEDIFQLAAENPILLILDGLDEVPQPKMRDLIFEELKTFLDRCESEDSSISVILSSRPQGYRGEFDEFQPTEWRVVDLSRNNFDEYSSRWLGERIPDLDQREDAQQKVSEGMESPAVQHMAKTLLQATVMLTIAKRKHVIPHAKHKLYKKFVEVVFEREQNKLPLIREKAEALKHLHENVGFELLCKMGTEGSAQTLEGKEFRTCVERVIIDYGNEGKSDSSFNETVDEILILAKDRLCLLAGKGDTQEDMDFVIQPFREYFAASYLANHAESCPHRTYTALMKRNHVWANVLQFYVAFQSPSQQLNWITEADGVELSENESESIIEMIRRRRTLIRVLPEFKRPRNEYIIRAFQNLMAISTRWTWRGRDSTANLLDAFSPKEAFKNLQANFQNLSTSDHHNLYVELDLLARTALPSDKEKVCDLLSELCTKDSTRSVAMSVAVDNDISINVSGICIQEIRNRLPYYTNRGLRIENWKGLSHGNLLDLYISKRFQSHFHVRFRENWINSLFGILKPQRRNIEAIEVSFPLYFYNRSDAEGFSLVSEKLRSIRGSSAAVYLLSLIDAIQDPTNLDLYKIAKNEESKLDFELELFLTVENQLGLGPSKFESEDAWIESRQSTFSLDDPSLINWVSKLNYGLSWLILLIPPEAIKLLDPLVPASKIREIEGPVLNRIHRMKQKMTKRIQILGHSNELFDLETLLLLVNFASKTDPSFLSEPSLIRNLTRNKILISDPEEAYNLLSAVSNLNSPSRFNSSVLGLCIYVEGINPDSLVEFWLKHCDNSQFIYVKLSRDRVIRNILTSDHKEAIQMAATINIAHSLAHKHRGSKAGLELTKRYCQLLHKNNYINEFDIAKLLQLNVHIDEVELWADPKILKILSSSELMMKRFHDRIKFLVSQFPSEHKRIRQSLGPIIESPAEYSIRISLAIVEAILLLDENTSEPLTPKDWQT